MANKQTNYNCPVTKPNIIWIYYRKKGELDAMRSRFGEKVTVATLDYLNGSMGNDHLKFECSFEQGPRLTVKMVENNTKVSESYFYEDADIVAVQKFACGGTLTGRPSDPQKPTSQPIR